MDFSKLSSNEKLAVYGAIASVVGPVLASVGFGFGAGFLTLLLALAMLAIVFLPQLSPNTTLPGSKGTLMVIVGGIAAVSAALSLLSGLGFLGFFGSDILFVLGWLIGIAGGLLMGWAGWQEFQAEGGNFQLGAPASTTTRSSTDGSATIERTDAAPPPVAAAPRAESTSSATPIQSPTSTAPAADSSSVSPGTPEATADPEDDRTDRPVV